MQALKMRLRQFERHHPILFALGFAGLVMALIILLPLTLIILHANIHHSYTYLYPADRITGIQLIELQGSVDLYRYPVDTIPAMLDDLTEVQAQIGEAQIQAFLSDLSEVPCHQWVNDPCPYVEQGTVLITYADGSREWICSRGTFYQDCSEDEASMTWYWFEDDSFAQLLQSYGYQ